MTEIVADDGDIDTGLKERDRATVLYDAACGRAVTMPLPWDHAACWCQRRRSWAFEQRRRGIVWRALLGTLRE